MNIMTLKLAASTLVLGMTMVGCKPAADSSRPRAISANAVKSDKDAARFSTEAQLAVQKGQLAEGLRLAEKAVELSPRDVGYRMLLGDLYIKNGRFASAESAFGDVLTLDPGNVRAGLNRALALIASGKQSEAVSQLDSLASVAPAADLGLAYALAGQPQRAIEMLDPAARETGAPARVRQNLALAYALAGDWQKAQTIAAQDVSPADLAARMQQWAAFAQPSAPSDQVATLLGVTAAADAGQPIHLALATTTAEPVAFAAAEPIAEPVPAAIQEVPAVYAEADAPQPSEVPQWVSETAPVEVAAVEAPEPAYVRAVQALVTPEPAVIRKARNTATVQATFKPAARATLRPAGKGAGRFAVQLGAYSTPASVERAWAGAYRRYGLTDHQPRSTTFAIAGRGTLHRLSVAGFGSHADASRTCGAIRAKGGSCFVRATAGDSPVRWASRYTSRRPA